MYKKYLLVVATRPAIGLMFLFLQFAISGMANQILYFKQGYRHLLSHIPVLLKFKIEFEIRILICPCVCS